MISATNNKHMSRKFEISDMEIPKIGLIVDKTNESPIVGVAMGKLKTPSSVMSKKRMMTPPSSGFGEVLLRCQVKTLLQKVKDESQFSKISMENNQFVNFQEFINSPISFLAPTPANTPLFETDLGTDNFKNVCLAAVTPSPIQEQLMISQIVRGTGMFNGLKQGVFESEENLITRSLLIDFSDNSEGSDLSDCFSALANEGDNNQDIKKPSALDDDSSFVVPLQVNIRAKNDDVQHLRCH